MAIKNDKPDLIPIMKKYGLSPKRINEKSAQFRCPFHNDTGRPNLHVWLETDTWKCFSCGDGGDVIDFVGLSEFGNRWNNRDRDMFLKVVEILDMKNYNPSKEKDANTEEYKPYVMPKATRDVLAYAAKIYHSVLINNKNGEVALQYLENRGFSKPLINKLQLGYVIPGVLANGLSAFPKPLKDAAMDAGLYYKGQNEKYREFLQGRITFPDFGPNGQIHNIVGRSLSSSKRYRFLALPGLPQSLYLLSTIPGDTPVLFMESITDAASARLLGFPAVACNGTYLSRENRDRMSKYPTVALYPQNDEAGRNAIAKWKEADIPHGRILNIPYRGGEKDLNDLLLNRGEGECRQIILDALRSANIFMQLFSPQNNSQINAYQYQ